LGRFFDTFLSAPDSDLYNAVINASFALSEV